MRAVVRSAAVTLLLCTGVVGIVDSSAQALQPAFSSNWSGFDVTSPSAATVRGVFATWTVPSVTCSAGETAYSATWAGIGGDLPPDASTTKQETLYQTGTDSNCVNGEARYDAFVEDYGTPNALATEFGSPFIKREAIVLGCEGGTPCPGELSVSAGDVITAAVVDHDVYTRWTISDSRSGRQIWSRTDTWITLAHRHSAECIEEDPEVAAKDGALGSMANFGRAVFSSCRASNPSGNLWSVDAASLPTGWTSHEISLEQKGVVIAKPITGPLEVVWIGVPSAATQISVGENFNCALLARGTVDCWGENFWGELGIGANVNYFSNTPVTVTGLTGVTQISLGETDACALMTGGTVECWGDNSQGELGNGTTTNASTPVEVRGLSGVTQLATGNGSNCALLTGGTVDCWGSNAAGQLGIGTLGAYSSRPVAVHGLSGATQISVGGGDACALMVGGGVACWGADTDGDLGVGLIQWPSTPIAVPGLSNVVQIAAGGEVTCALMTGGAVECWGNNSNGQLGNGTTTNDAFPAPVPGLPPVSQLAVGSYYSICALTTDGTVDCWGGNTNGQLGDGTYQDSSVPTGVTGLTDVDGVAVGYVTSCALLTSGAIECWGYVKYAPFGTITTPSPNSTIPVAVEGFS